MSQLNELMTKYDEEMKVIRRNRKVIKDSLKENRGSKIIIRDIKKEIKNIVGIKLQEGQSLYRISIENFGKIDKRFHILFALFNKRQPKKRK